MRNKTLQSFIDYADAHPEQRFWQALANWANVNYILIAKNSSWYYDTDQQSNLTDTFYFKGKNK